MTVRQRRWTVMVAAVAASLGIARGSDATDYSRLASSVVRVDCLLDDNRSPTASKDRVGTGFVWNATGSVVTALHVVGGCKKLRAFFEKSGGEREAKIVKVLKAADLALLQITDPPPAPPLQEATNDPTYDDQLVTLGYQLGSPTMSSTHLNVRYGSNKLKDFVSDDVARELLTTHIPDPALIVTAIEGHLVHGLSGAPIMTLEGKLVAIGDGGLENGAVGISWGIPRNNLKKLLTSAEATEISVRQTATAFAAEVYRTTAPAIHCGDVELTRIREFALPDAVRSVSANAGSTDDLLGLSQLMNTGGIDPAQLRFQTYQNLTSGATVVLPAGATLAVVGNHCTARTRAHGIELLIGLALYNGEAEVQNLSSTFEAWKASLPLNMWQQDPAWSYWSPRKRFDGLVVRRKSLVKFTYGNYGPRTSEYLFETLAAKRGVFLGVKAVNHDWTPETVQHQQMCRMAQADPACAATMARFREWGEAVIAAHLSSFPIG
jgi:Trypsin-like peptidase domain